MNEKIIVVGASTGGTEALKMFLINMPEDSPAILVVQHMPEAFTNSFAERLDSLCRVSVKEAGHNERILQGHVYIAPGHSHLLIKPNRGYYETELSKSAPINLHRPSVEALFVSAAEHVGPNAVGIILTGMGKDGAHGMQEMHKAGAYNFAQDESTSVVFGMPRKAIMLGAVDEVVPIHEMATRVIAYLKTA
jgi:two-component system, chemotaxis family, protein-glutamate methylesterase/glutaminase